jgi:hypothetical protein
MGGYSSGRRNGGPVVEDGLKLDLAHGIRKGLIQPGSYVAGTIQWTLTRTGEVKAEISYVANLVDPVDAWVWLIYTSTTRATGAKLGNDYRLRLETTRPHFGGLLWWFLCPITGRRGRTRASRIGPVTSHAASTRPPQSPEHRMRRRTSPTVICRP